MRSAGLSPAEQRVSRQVLSHPEDVLELSVTELAARSDTSVGTVMRFCTRLGLRGYQDLKLNLARTVISVTDSLAAEVHADDTDDVVLAKVLASSATAISHASDLIDSTALTAIVDSLVTARRVAFAAVGTSAPLAADISYRLTTIGVDATFTPDPHVQHVTARMLGPGDVCFAISHTGSTQETLAVMRTAAQTGATTAALTSFTSSPLTDIVDHRLVAGSRETSYRIESMTSRLVHLAVLDAIHVALVLRRDGCREALAASGDIITEHRI
ncbi:MurR/RpiR family transcriptional regulator [Rhodococcus sp. SBT000017]|nr:MurR/RpiR family transcriptional regulator [Rhodococcus sp. SBT000017]